MLDTFLCALIIREADTLCILYDAKWNCEKLAEDHYTLIEQSLHLKHPKSIDTLIEQPRYNFLVAYCGIM